MDEWKMVLPGEQVATVEEYEPGERTYEAEGKVFAGWVGVLQLDDDARLVEKAVHVAGLARQVLAQRLDHHQAHGARGAERAGQEHVAHAALRDRAQQQVAGEAAGVPGWRRAELRLHGRV